MPTSDRDHNRGGFNVVMPILTTRWGEEIRPKHWRTSQLRVQQRFLFTVRLPPGCQFGSVSRTPPSGIVAQLTAKFKSRRCCVSSPLSVEPHQTCRRRRARRWSSALLLLPLLSPSSSLSHPRLQSTIISASNTPEGKQTFKKFPITRQAKPIFLSMQLTAPTFTII